MLGCPSLRAFLLNETGAITVDWVILASGTVGMGLIATNVIAVTMSDLSNEIRNKLEADMLSNPFDVLAEGETACARLYLDPYADPNATPGLGSDGCTVGGEPPAP
ncbi:MAG: hypothetical protein AAGF88_04645 [Pseudomonadota bacterium]